MICDFKNVLSFEGTFFFHLVIGELPAAAMLDVLPGLTFVADEKYHTQ